MRQIYQDPSTIVEAKWVAPPPGSFNMNSDASVGSAKMSYRAVIYDSNGETLLVMERFQPFIRSMELVMALVPHESIPKALEAGIHPLRI